MSDKCQVCGAENKSFPIDSLEAICGLCNGNGKVAKKDEPGKDIECPQCRGSRQIQFPLRDKQFWVLQDILSPEETEQIGMRICQNCGFVDYTPRWSAKKLKNYYKNARTKIDIRLIIQARKKAIFHKYMLSEAFDLGKGEHRKGGEKIEAVLDIGAGIGETRKLFPKSVKVYCTEHSNALLNYAEAENGMIPIQDPTHELRSKSLDLVIMYHVLEHLQNPKKELEKVYSLLRPNGLFYCAVPDYLGDLREVSGNSCVSFEQLFHLNHLNVFSKISFVNLLRGCGFHIIKQNENAYGFAVLCKKSSEKRGYIVEDWKAIVNILVNQRKAIELLAHGLKDQHNHEKLKEQVQASISAYPKYRDALLVWSQLPENVKNYEKLFNIFAQAQKLMPKDLRLKTHFAQQFLKFCEINKPDSPRLKIVISLFSEVLENDPGAIDAMEGLLNIYSTILLDKEKMEEMGKRICAINPGAANMMLEKRIIYHELLRQRNVKE